MSQTSGTGPYTQHSKRPDPPVTIKTEWCKACGICVEFCPKKALDVDEEGRPVVVRPEACGLCGICEQLCPDFAIRVRREERAPKD